MEEVEAELLEAAVLLEEVEAVVLEEEAVSLPVVVLEQDAEVLEVLELEEAEVLEVLELEQDAEVLELEEAVGQVGVLEVVEVMAEEDIMEEEEEEVMAEEDILVLVGVGVVIFVQIVGDEIWICGVQVIWWIITQWRLLYHLPDVYQLVLQTVQWITLVRACSVTTAVKSFAPILTQTLLHVRTCVLVTVMFPVKAQPLCVTNFVKARMSAPECVTLPWAAGSIPANKCVTQPVNKNKTHTRFWLGLNKRPCG